MMLIRGRGIVMDASPDQYVTLLEHHLGTSDQFESAVRQLENEPTDVIMTVAKKFADVAKSQGRGYALRKIRARNHSLLQAQAKSESRMGRSAG